MIENRNADPVCHFWHFNFNQYFLVTWLYLLKYKILWRTRTNAWPYQKKNSNNVLFLAHAIKYFRLTDHNSHVSLLQDTFIISLPTLSSSSSQIQSRTISTFFYFSYNSSEKFPFNLIEGNIFMKMERMCVADCLCASKVL